MRKIILITTLLLLASCSQQPTDIIKYIWTELSTGAIHDRWAKACSIIEWEYQISTRCCFTVAYENITKDCNLESIEERAFIKSVIDITH